MRLHSPAGPTRQGLRRLPGGRRIWWTGLRPRGPRGARWRRTWLLPGKSGSGGNPVRHRGTTFDTADRPDIRLRHTPSHGKAHKLIECGNNTRKINVASCSVPEPEAKFHDRMPTGAEPRLAHASERNEQEVFVPGETATSPETGEDRAGADRTDRTDRQGKGGPAEPDKAAVFPSRQASRTGGRVPDFRYRRPDHSRASRRMSSFFSKTSIVRKIVPQEGSRLRLHPGQDPAGGHGARQGLP